MSDLSICTTFTATCWDCGRKVRVVDGRQRRHACRLRWLSRARWRACLDGWHSGYRFAVEHRDEPLVLADADDYGTGWAGHMRVGAVTVNMNETERADD